ncbi:MAG: hypothetical protein M1837_005222 [Sclerophora amabilis]|nr:MAG: hypothetical protein M1837_005222 [Sclerophora amabilis]
MLPPPRYGVVQRAVSHPSICLPARPLHPASALPALVRITNHPSHPTTRPSQNRGFWWSRCQGRTTAAYHLDPRSERRVVAKKDKNLRYRYDEASRRSQPWDRRVIRTGWGGWRLASSWGRSSRTPTGGRWVEDTDHRAEKKGFRDAGGREEPPLPPPPSSRDPRLERMERRMEAIRRQVEEDPFGAIFGRRLEKTVDRAGSWFPNSLLATWGWTRFTPRKFGDSSRSAGRSDQSTQTPMVPKGTEKDDQSNTTGESKRPTNAVSSETLTRNQPGAQKQETVIRDEFEFDPITMRRVPKRTTPVASSDGTIIIPVKKFQEDTSRPGGPEPRDWPKGDRPGHQQNFKADTVTDGHLPPVRPTDSNETIALSEPLTSGSTSGERPRDPIAAQLEGQDKQESIASSSPARNVSTGWLAAEGFASTDPKITESASQTAKPAEGVSTPNVILEEFGVPREEPSPSVSSKASPLQSRSHKRQHPSLEYDISESKAEDLDLLRSSDVRAAAGVAKNPTKETDAEKYAKREKLEKDFSRFGQHSNAHAEMLAAQEAIKSRKSSSLEPEPRQKSSAPSWEQPSLSRDSSDIMDEFSSGTTSKGARSSDATKVENEVQGSENAYAAEMQAQETMKGEVHGLYGKASTTHETSQVPADESNDYQAKLAANIGVRPQPASKAEVHPMKGEGDVSANLGKYADRSPLSSQKVMEHSARNADRQLVGELRTIYEDEYGSIDADHRQLGSLAEAAKSSEPEPRPLTGSESRGAAPCSAGKTEPESQATSDETALRMEEKEQILQEDVREIADEVHEIRSEVREAERDLAATAPSAEEPEPTRTEPVSSNRSSSSIYKILAYDPATQDMSTATATSSSEFTSSSPSQVEKILSPPDVLHQLNNPARFLPYFANLQADGFEIVSGKGDVLVFKKVRDPEPAATTTTTGTEDSSFIPGSGVSAINPIDGTTTGNFASPTGFVNHDAVFPPPLSEPSSPPPPPPPPPSSQVSSSASPTETLSPSPPPSSTSTSTSTFTFPARDRVHRQEDVFSGQSRWTSSTKDESEHSGSQQGQTTSSSRGGRIRRTAKRAFWVGVWCAGCCYATGVVLEFFRTGGAGGLGVQGL